MKINYLRHSPTVLVGITAIGLAMLSFNAHYGWWSSPATDSVVTPHTTVAPTSGNNAIATVSPIRFLEVRVKQDPDDFVAYNKLAAYYLQLVRETGNLAYLDLTSRAARASLSAIPAEQNTGGLAALAQAEYASHNFAKARDHAIQLTKLEPGKSHSYQILGDALLELGDYEQAIAAFRKMESLSGGISVSTETRLARLAVLRGKASVAQRHFSNALALTLDLPVPPPESVAWLLAVR